MTATSEATTTGAMQLVNKERQRKIRHELLTEAPNEGTPEREMYVTLNPPLPIHHQSNQPYHGLSSHRMS